MAETEMQRPRLRAGSLEVREGCGGGEVTEGEQGQATGCSGDGGVHADLPGTSE